MRLMLKAAAAAGWVILLWLLVDWGKAAEALVDASFVPLAGAFAISVLGVLISAEKWRGLLRHERIDLSLGITAQLYWIGMFFSNFLPTGVGGDAVRLALTPARGRGLAPVAATILVERLTGLLVLLALCALGLGLRPGKFDDVASHRLLSVGILSLGLIAAALLLAPDPLACLLGALADRLPQFLRHPLDAARSVAAAVADQARDPAALGRALLLSLPFYGTVLLAQYLVLRAVGAPVAVSEVALLGGLVPLLTLLPVTPNGLGLAEAVFVLLYSQAGGVSPELALAAAVLRRLVDVANSSIGGVLWLRWPDDKEAEAHDRLQREPVKHGRR